MVLQGEIVWQDLERSWDWRLLPRITERRQQGAQTESSLGITLCGVGAGFEFCCTVRQRDLARGVNGCSFTLSKYYHMGLLIVKGSCGRV